MKINKGMMIEPTPMFVIKTYDKHREKVFLNMTEHAVIDEPEEKYLVDYDVKFYIISFYHLLK